jgi:ankyrin repeat protein
MLHYAITEGKNEIAILLIESGANLNLDDMVVVAFVLLSLILPQEGTSPLMLACSANNYEIARSLILNGAFIDTQEQVTGDSALIIACREKHENIVRLLLTHGANLHLLNKVKSSLIHPSMHPYSFREGTLLSLWLCD